MKPDYNDGNWHGWNGGECPVHPKSLIEYFWAAGPHHGMKERIAGEDEKQSYPSWSGQLKAFRVVKPYREPRVWYAVGETLHDTAEKAEKFLAELLREHGDTFNAWRVIKVVEVLE